MRWDQERISKPVVIGKNAHPTGVRRSFFPASGHTFFDRSPVTLVAGLRFETRYSRLVVAGWVAAVTDTGLLPVLATCARCHAIDSTLVPLSVQRSVIQPNHDEGGEALR
jgi:hypothetical protein